MAGTRGNRAPPERLAKVEQAMRECWSPGRIERHFAKQWEVTPRTIRTYISVITKRWAEEASAVDKDAERALTVDLFGEIYRRSMAAATATGEGKRPDAAAHYRVALQAADRRALYLGLRPTAKVQIEDGDGKPLTVSAKDAAAELAAAIDRVTARKGEPEE